jgi:hypothetical protein
MAVKWPRVRFTIWQIMIVIMAVAVLLALPSGWGMLALSAVAIPFLGTI